MRPDARFRDLVLRYSPDPDWLPSVSRDITDAIHAELPPLDADPDLRLIGLAVGLLGALWASLGVTLAFGRAFAQIWDVPRFARPSGVKARLRGLAVLVILGVTLVAATAAAGLASGSDLGDGFGAAAQRV